MPSTRSHLCSVAVLSIIAAHRPSQRSLFGHSPCGPEETLDVEADNLFPAPKVCPFSPLSYDNWRDNLDSWFTAFDTDEADVHGRDDMVNPYPGNWIEKGESSTTPPTAP